MRLLLDVKDDASAPLVRLGKAVGALTPGAGVYVGVRATKGSSLVVKALANEFGTATIPERSFLRSTLDRRRVEYADILAELVNRSLDGQPARIDLERLGAIVVGDVQMTISSNVPPPNAASTIRRKRSSRTLIDTGRLRQSISYEVAMGEEDTRWSSSDNAGSPGAVIPLKR